MLHHDKPVLSPAVNGHREMETLMSTVGKWGMEAGFLGLDDYLEPRLAALVREGAERLFGSCASERDRLRVELETVESDWERAARQTEGYRARMGTLRAGRGLLTALRTWYWDFRECRAARTRCGEREPALRKARVDLAAAERKCGEAQAWSEIAIQALRANYGFQKARAASLRPEKEMSNDTRETRHFVLHRAN